MLGDILQALIDLVELMGYYGIFIMSFIESTLVPIPSEVTLIPAGYLAADGKMSLYLLIPISVVGTVAGSWLNYYIASKYGRKWIIQYGQYIRFKKEQLEKIEEFFKKHGQISVFIGRLLPGVKHVISLPAGLANMDIKPFFIYTFIGGFIWNTSLIILGFIIGKNDTLINKYLYYINIALIISILVIIAIYIYKKRR